MIARELVGTAQVPHGEELRLYRHDRDYFMMLGRNELMSSRMSGSEVALAAQSAGRVADKVRPEVLIGGYGMGFTLRAALTSFGADARITVAELVPEVIAWARGPMRDLAAGCLDDPRVALHIGDVADRIAAGTGCYDAILLDVDNGPDGLTRAGNDRLYSRAGLQAARAALKSGGVLAVWSAARDDRFGRRLRQAGFLVEELSVRARSNGKGPAHIIWFAEVP